MNLKMSEQILMKLVGLWFALSVGTLAATVSPSASPDENTKLTPASSSLGPVYREARDYNAHESGVGGSGGSGGGGGGYNYRPYDRPQQSRCISCLYAAMTGNQDRDRPGYPSQGGNLGGGSYGMQGSYGQRENEDRNWYYQPDDRNRYSQYENRYYQQQNRNDYRPASGGSYDRNDYRQNYQDYRGNGYDNRDAAYYSSMKGSGAGGMGSVGGAGGNRGYANRDGSYESYYDDRMSNRGYSGSAGGYGPQNYYMRPSYQSNGYDQDRYYAQGRPYDRPERPERPEYYDRNSGYGGGYGSMGGAGGGSSSSGGYGGNRGGSSNAYGYDEMNFRPWDQTYRGVSGFDSLGHGHYFANYPNSHSNGAQPSLPQNNPHQQAPPRPFQQPSGHHESSGQSHHSQHNSYDSDSLGGHGSSGGHGTGGTSSSSSSGNSNNNKGSYGGNWNYINSNDRNSVHGQQGYGQTQEKDTPQSSPYGERPGQRPLSTSYLHERDTPTVISGDNASDAANTTANQIKQTKTNNSNSDNGKSNVDNTDKINTQNNTHKNPIDESNTVSTASTDTN